MRLTQDVLDLTDSFFEVLRAAGASEELIADLAMTLVRHADRSVAVIPFPTGHERTARQARRELRVAAALVGHDSSVTDTGRRADRQAPDADG